MSVRDAALVLADGSVFEGEALGDLPSGRVATGLRGRNARLS